MAQILFLIGAALLFMGKLRLANIDAEGNPVRAAGFMLMMPLISVILLGYIVGLMGQDNQFATNLLILSELPIVVICAWVAYKLLRDATQPAIGSGHQDANSTSAPSIPEQPTRDDIHQATNESGTQTETTNDPPPVKTPAPRPFLQSFLMPAAPAQDTSKLPTIMNTAEAAKYLNITEQEVLRLIEDGKLVAAKINYRYRISRSVLDEFIEDQQGNSSPATE